MGRQKLAVPPTSNTRSAPAPEQAAFSNGSKCRRARRERANAETLSKIAPTPN